MPIEDLPVYHSNNGADSVQYTYSVYSVLLIVGGRKMEIKWPINRNLFIDLYSRYCRYSRIQPTSRASAAIAATASVPVPVLKQGIYVIP